MLTLLLVVGCQSREEIQTYTVPRTSEPTVPVDVAGFRKQLDHTLAAILPQDKQAWFFKLTAPAPALDRQRDAVVDFLETIDFDPEAGDAPTWELPAAWQERGPSEMRTATLVVPDEDGPLEISVSSLPLTDNWEDFVVRNVNRWIGQLSQAPLSAATVLELAKPVETRAGEATLVELAGLSRQQPRSDPHAGIPAAPPETKPTGPLSYDTPAGWQPGEMNAMRRAAFRIVDGDATAEMTVTTFPAAPGTQMADVSTNVRRWAGQVGLGTLDDAGLDELVQQITVDEIEGNLVQLVGPELPTGRRAMLAAMINREGSMWFFKLMGDADLVEAQGAAFREFLASVRFLQ